MLHQKSLTKVHKPIVRPQKQKIYIYISYTDKQNVGSVALQFFSLHINACVLRVGQPNAGQMVIKLPQPVLHLYNQGCQMKLRAHPQNRVQYRPIKALATIFLNQDFKQIRIKSREKLAVISKYVKRSPIPPNISGGDWPIWQPCL